MNLEELFKDIENKEEVVACIRENFIEKEKVAELERRHEQERYRLQRDNALNAAILAAGGKNSRAIRALLPLEKIELQEDGTLAGLDLEELKKTDGYLFRTEEKKAVGTGAPRATTAKPDWNKMSYTEMCEYLEKSRDGGMKYGEV